MKKLTVMIFFFCLFNISFAPVNPKDKEHEIETYFRSADLSPERLIAALKFNQVISPEIVLAQCKLESGHFRSELCQQYNNLFGMKWPWARENKCSGVTEEGFAIYDTWYDAVLDMKLFQRYYLLKGRDLSDYYSFLVRMGYAEDPHYLIKLRRLCTL